MCVLALRSPFACESSLPDRWSWLDDPGDRPDEADHLPRDRGGHDDLGLARRGQATIAVAQAQLRPPGDVADRLRQTFDSIEELAADPRLHAVGPGALDQHAPCVGVAGLGDAAWRMLLPLERSEGTSPR
jgi:hypothetical protein